MEQNRALYGGHRVTADTSKCLFGYGTGIDLNGLHQCMEVDSI